MNSGVWRIVIIVALVVAVAMVIAAKSKPPTEPDVTAGPVVHPAASAKKLPKMIELGSTTCTPCKMMEKVLAELRKDYPDTLVVEFINTEEEPKMAEKYKIELIPTQVFLDADGKEFHRHIGFFPKDDIVATFAKQGIKLDK